MRIVSLLPSATEIICQLGLENQLVGVTHECDYPTAVQQLPKVTRTHIPHDAPSGEIDILVRERLKTSSALYSLDMAMLTALAPDLIVTQALCDVCAVAEAEVQQAARTLPHEPNVVNLEPMNLSQVFECLATVGKAAGCAPRATSEIAELRNRVQVIKQRTEQADHRHRVMLLEWIDPPFCAGHWSPELVRLAGGVEVIGRPGERSSTTAWQEIVAADPEVLFIACCGFDVPRTLKDVEILRGYPLWDSLHCVRHRQVFVVDGSAYFSRPGPRLVDSLEILAHTLHPDLHPLPQHLAPATRVLG